MAPSTDVTSDHHLTPEELNAIYMVERLLRILNQRTHDDDYGELADLLALKLYGPKLVTPKGDDE